MFKHVVLACCASLLKFSSPEVTSCDVFGTSKLLNARGQKRAKNARGQPVGSIRLLAYDAGLPESPI